MDLAFRPAGELARMIRDKEISAAALLEHYLERLGRFNPALNAVVATDLDAARARAREADAALARGELWGPLHGVPMTIKDTFEVVGMPTTAGAPAYKDHRPQNNAVAVQRLLDAGAVVFGKTNVPLFAGDLQSYNDVYGTTNNPWNLSRTPGGSSGGAAAALAAGLCALELGSDIGGSIRTPANFCGVCGHKPSYGLIPARGHIPGPPGSLHKADIGVMGPLARYVDDLALALDILAGPDSDEAVGWKLQLPAARHQRLTDFRVAAWLDDPACPIDAEVVATLRGVAERLRAEGVAVDEQARPAGIELEQSHEVYYSLLTATMGAGLPPKAFETMVRTAAEAAPDDRRYTVRFARGAVQRHAQWLQTDERRQQMRRAWAEFFRRYDALLAPATHTLPFPHDHSNPIGDRVLPINGQPRPYMDVLVWAGLGGVVYLPATVVPVGRSRDGLPIGIQIIGPYLEDRTTLAFAKHLERLLGGFTPPPGY